MIRIRGEEYIHPMMGSVASEDAAALRQELVQARKTIAALETELRQARANACIEHLQRLLQPRQRYAAAQLRNGSQV